MPHHPCPSTAWRSATLRIAELDSLGTETGQPWLTTVGTFANETAGEIPTRRVRDLVLGETPHLHLGGGAAPAFRARLATAAEITPAELVIAGAAA